MRGLASLEYARALDVAGGDGRLSKELLLELFGAVDLFDRCKVALAKVGQLKALLPKLKRVDEATMQDYQFKERYNLVMMCWCCGYLDNDELIAFLIKAQAQLVRGFKRTTRNQQPVAYIVVLDNLAEEGEGTVWVDDQRVREESTFKSIFDNAGLTVWDQTEPEVLVDADYPVKMWALA